ncbi:hypothetical protein [Shimazuella kribbensis]|uniref:hypothetical protein n=1 Tax=Shimazuella kribbensis TaxID=139808 RepID=UPI00048B52D2|nr:hypothetical protein [Shimazuella kribbensis]
MINWKNFISVLLLFSLTGCNLFPFPTDLLQKPSNNQGDAFRVFSSFIPRDYKMLVPQQSDYTGAINLVDLDQDSHPEIVGIVGAENGLGLLLIILHQKNRQWELATKITIPNHDRFHYLAFRDVAGDKRPEVIIGTTNASTADRDGEKYLSVFRIQTDYSYSLVLKQQYLYNVAIEDWTNDKRDEMLIFTKNKENQLIAQFIQCIQNCKQLDSYLFPTEFSSNSALFFDNVLQATTVNLKYHQKGVFVTLSAYDSHLYTTALVIENGRLKNLMAGKEAFTVQTFYRNSSLRMQTQDNNKDGIAEIKSNTSLPTDIQYDAYTFNGKMTIWYQLDKNNNLQPVKKIYTDEQQTFEFDIPPTWDQHIQLTELSPNQLQISYRNKAKKWIPLYTLHHIPINKWSDFQALMKKREESYTLLNKNQNKILVLSITKESSHIPEKYKANLQKWEKSITFLK